MLGSAQNMRAASVVMTDLPTGIPGAGMPFFFLCAGSVSFVSNAGFVKDLAKCRFHPRTAADDPACFAGY